ncbi:Homeobox-leucine zipper protein HOX32 [Platanthera zijinensis]|uniref:Homeobox-leucine zipper protein HOX32 n=1 Tax=Platanthera zijinensis TaxID=2320716 RepID=A0AAP0AXU6_9ASPA
MTVSVAVIGDTVHGYGRVEDPTRACQREKRARKKEGWNPAADGASEHQSEDRDRIRGENSFAKLSIRLVFHGAKADFKGNDSQLEHVKLFFLCIGKPSPASVRCREKQRKESFRLQTVNRKLTAMNKLMMEENDRLQKQVSQLVYENGYMCQQVHTIAIDLFRIHGSALSKISPIWFFVGYSIVEHDPEAGRLKLQFARFPGPRFSGGPRHRR